MKSQEQLMMDRMRQTIRKSCVYQGSKNPYYEFQKSILRHFFNVADVSIDPKRKSIYLYINHYREQPAPDLYNLNDVVAITIYFSNLEETLKGCLESDEKSKRLYTSLLFSYQNVSGQSNNLLSA